MIQVMEFPSRKVLGLSANFLPAVHEESNAQEVIGALWGEMSYRFFNLSLKRDPYPLGIGAMWEDDSGNDGTMRYFAGYEIHDAPEDPAGLEFKEIAGGKYAFATHVGPISELPLTVKRFYSETFPQSGYRRRAGMDLEVYSDVDESGFPSRVLVAVPIE